MGGSWSGLAPMIWSWRVCSRLWLAATCRDGKGGSRLGLPMIRAWRVGSRQLLAATIQGGNGGSR